MTSYLSIDIGGTFIKYVISDTNFHLQRTSKIETPTTMADFLSQLDHIIQSYQTANLKGIAISCPGQINAKTGFIYSGGLITYLKVFPLGKYLSDKYQLPVSLINDGKAAGLAEARLGGLKAIASGAVLVLGTGVGYALVADGQLSRAPLSSKYDLDHMAVEQQESSHKRPIRFIEDIDLMSKGINNLRLNNGSAVQFISQASHLLGLEQSDGLQVFDCLEKKKNPELNTLFEQYCQDIAYLILNLRNLFPLEKLLIGGGISQQPLLIKGIKKAYSQLVIEQNYPSLYATLPIEACQFKNDANLLGAICHLTDNLHT